MSLKKDFQKKMKTWVSSQIDDSDKERKLNIRCPWPYLIYEPKKPNTKEKS